jgi:hypothetical protein
MKRINTLCGKSAVFQVLQQVVNIITNGVEG